MRRMTKMLADLQYSMAPMCSVVNTPKHFGQPVTICTAEAEADAGLPDRFPIRTTDEKISSQKMPTSP